MDMNLDWMLELDRAYFSGLPIFSTCPKFSRGGMICSEAPLQAQALPQTPNLELEDVTPVWEGARCVPISIVPSILMAFNTTYNVQRMNASGDHPLHRHRGTVSRRQLRVATLSFRFLRMHAAIGHGHHCHSSSGLPSIQASSKHVAVGLIHFVGVSPRCVPGPPRYACCHVYPCSDSDPECEPGTEACCRLARARASCIMHYSRLD